MDTWQISCSQKCTWEDLLFVHSFIGIYCVPSKFHVQVQMLGDSSMVTVHYYKMKPSINDKGKLKAL